MNTMHLAVREIQESDIPLIAGYWLHATPSFLRAMGADPAKMPTENEWTEMLTLQLATQHPFKQSWCIVWLIDGIPSGHSNITNIVYADKARMHLHLWQGATRKKGAGTSLVRMTLPLFFETYRLKNLYCEPYALNPAPNNTLQKVGFDFIEQLVMIPGSLNFEQPVNRWLMTAEKLRLLNGEHLRNDYCNTRI